MDTLKIKTSYDNNSDVIEEEIELTDEIKIIIEEVERRLNDTFNKCQESPIPLSEYRIACDICEYKGHIGEIYLTSLDQENPFHICKNCLKTLQNEEFKKEEKITLIETDLDVKCD